MMDKWEMRRVAGVPRVCTSNAIEEVQRLMFGELKCAVIEQQQQQAALAEAAAGAVMVFGVMGQLVISAAQAARRGVSNCHCSASWMRADELLGLSGRFLQQLFQARFVGFGGAVAVSSVEADAQA
jgi:ribosome biogenesis protein Tsr3